MQVNRQSLSSHTSTGDERSLITEITPNISNTTGSWLLSAAITCSALLQENRRERRPWRSYAPLRDIDQVCFVRIEQLLTPGLSHLASYPRQKMAGAWKVKASLGAPLSTL
jgi:hypothetical protein